MKGNVAPEDWITKDCELIQKSRWFPHAADIVVSEHSGRYVSTCGLHRYYSIYYAKV